MTQAEQGKFTQMENEEERMLRGREMLWAARQLDEAEYAARATLAARSEAAMRNTPVQAIQQNHNFSVFDRRDGNVIGHVKSGGGRFTAHDATGLMVAECRSAHEALRAVEQGATDSSWTEIIAAQSPGANHARPHSPADFNFGWGSIMSQVEAEQPNVAAATSSDDHGWTEIMARMNSQNGVGA
jgi:hypothetical protein